MTAVIGVTCVTPFLFRRRRLRRLLFPLSCEVGSVLWFLLERILSKITST